MNGTDNVCSVQDYFCRKRALSFRSPRGVEFITLLDLPCFCVVGRVLRLTLSDSSLRIIPFLLSMGGTCECVKISLL